jgi:hypothetical protein
LVALGLHGHDAVTSLAAKGSEDEIGIDCAPSPATQAVAVPVDAIPVPPADCGLVVQINGDVAFRAIEIGGIDWQEQAALQSPPRRSGKLRGADLSGGPLLARHDPVTSVAPQAELDLAGIQALAKQHRKRALLETLTGSYGRAGGVEDAPGLGRAPIEFEAAVVLFSDMKARLPSLIHGASRAP